MALFCTRFPIEPKINTYDHKSIGFFPGECFLERKLGVSVFSSLFKWGGISLVENDFEWQSERKNHQKMGFPLPRVTYLAENLSGLKIFCSLSFIDRELFYFPLISFLLPSDLWSGILLFLYFHFSFLFFIFIFPFSSFSFFSLGNRVFAFYLLSLVEIPLSFASWERMRILFYRSRFKKV